tara:strand:- start:1846 stop:2442 length:597 start_codon:yes stop_codon:yes gene_type:complete
MDYDIKKPEEIIHNEWKQLSDAVKDARHGYHLFTLSTVKDEHPELRTVVLRQSEEKEKIISFHTDKRSPKYYHLLKNNNISALFYDSSRRIQLRIKGTAIDEKNNSILKKLWEKMNKDSRQCYQGEIAPSNPLGEGVLVNKISPNDQYIDTELLGFENFSRIVISISEIEILMLHHHGHRRLKCNIRKNVPSYTWIAS